MSIIDWLFRKKKVETPVVTKTVVEEEAKKSELATPGSRKQDDNALLEAAQKGESRSVYSLLEQGANINARHEQGYTPFTIACFQGHTELVKLLLDRGADVNTIDDFFGTGLMAASANGQIDVVRLLLDRGAKVNTRDKQGKTALINAAISSGLPGRTEVAELLLRNGADVNAQMANSGVTALSFAAGFGNLVFVSLLLKGGADPNIRIGSQETVLSVAEAKGHTEVVKLLRSYGAK